MKKVYLTLAAVAIMFASCKDDDKTEVEIENNTTETTDNVEVDREEMPDKPMDSAAVQKAWREYMTPSKVHEMLAEETGKWDNKMTFWMGPDAPPQTENSVSTIKMIMGDRYQETMYDGNMMGMPFTGRGLLAYDNATEEFITTWIDNMGTGIMVLRGKHDKDNKTTTMTGEMVDPITKKNIAVREVYTIVDENTRKMEMYHDRGDGNEYKSMEIIMTRKS